ncbi:hypothetical protein [uncultured Bdellovibrio sp.]|uniref:hypothetical protein n=1 Tax=Bdellovibrio sp. HCB-162 TaxID=3394234 RepID=UPI0025FFA7F0|nr:hypothetical protein [uncultured Bdellovibrio sp.]
MKSFILSLTSFLALVSSPAHAFISSQEETLLVEAMNQVNPAQVHVENIRCSLRNRMCLVKMEVGAHQRRAGCMIERISDAADLYTENVDKATGKTVVSLSPYTQDSLDRCVSQVL